MRSFIHCLLIACLVATINATNATETSATTEAAAAANTTEAPAAPESPISQPQIEITKLELKAHELEALLQLDEAINEQQQQQEQLAADDKQPQRAARHIKDEQLTTETERKPATLSDDDINAIMQMIKFPADGQQEVMKVDNETHKVNADEIEPRQSGNRQGRGYYILAFAPANDDDEVAQQEQLNYNRIDIIPEERFSGKAARYYKQEKRVEEEEEGEQVNREDNDEEEAINDDEDYDLFGRNAEALDEDEAEDEVEARFISMKQLNRYIRRLMRQIRKGTRKITRKTRVKKKSADPTVENFLKGLYKAQQQKKAKKSAWFSW